VQAAAAQLICRIHEGLLHYVRLLSTGQKAQEL
jgi:hypothetical protein